MIDKGWIDIEVIAGDGFRLEKVSANQQHIPNELHLHVPDVSRAYTVRDLVSELSAKYEKLGNLIRNGKTGRLKGNALIILNGMHVDLLSGLNTPIHVGDRIELIPIIGGG